MVLIDQIEIHTQTKIMDFHSSIIIRWIVNK